VSSHNGARSFFRIVHATSEKAELLANELADEYQMSAINFYVLEGVEKVAMMFVRKQAVPVVVNRKPGTVW
jgi:hypothetical protein